MPSNLFKFGNYTFTSYVQDWSESVPQRIETVVVPRRDGVLAGDGRPEAKRVTIRGILHAASAADLRTLEDAVLQAFRNTGGSSPVAALRVWDDRYINAQLDSWQSEYMKSAVPFGAKRWQAQFLAATPYWLADTPSTQTETPAGVSHTFTLSGAGSAEALPVITLTAGAAVDAGLKLVNATDNSYLQYNAAMSLGDVLVLDHEALTAKDNGANVLASIAGDFWPILPGANTVIYTGSTASVAIKVDWRDRWH